jgi:hypothetical protein
LERIQTKDKKREIFDGDSIVTSHKALADPKKVAKLLKRSGLTDQEQLCKTMKALHVRDGHACVQHPDKPRPFIVKASFFDHASAAES